MMPSRSTIAGELCSWLSTVGGVAVETEPSGGETRVVICPDRDALRAERTRLLAAYRRRVIDEREVGSAERRDTVERTHRFVRADREWIALIRGAASDRSN